MTPQVFMNRLLRICWVACGLAAQGTDGLHEHARAQMRQARQTGNVSFYEAARRDVEKSLALKPSDYESQKLETTLLLRQGEYTKARASALLLRKRNMDDPEVHSLLAEADLQLGNYKDVEETVQWMLDLRPGNSLSLERAATLRFYLGDVDGAAEMWNAAHRAVSDPEERSWMMTQLAEEQLAVGKTAVAAKVVPDTTYRPAKLVRAKVWYTEGKFAQATDLLADVEPSYLRAQALQKAGKSVEAAQAFQQFEQTARAKVDQPLNWNRDLILYLVDQARKPVDALQVAKKELERRKDVYTLDAYAWALQANRQNQEARKIMEKIQAVGIRDTEILEHIRQINPGR